ncbi:MAG: GNAT family N-acetyltransferase [Pseudomonadota bacterium]
MTVLETERLVLRPPKADDFDRLKPFLMTDRARFVGGGADKDETHAWRVLAILCGHWALRGYGTFVAEERATSTPVASVGPWFPAGWPEREIGWAVWSEAAEGMGFAREAARRVVTHVFDDLGWQTAVSYIDPANTRSIALAERLGAVHDTAANGPEATDLVYRHRRIA